MKQHYNRRNDWWSIWLCWTERFQNKSFLSLTMIWVRLYAVWEKQWPVPAASAAGAGQLFSAQMGKWRTAIARSMCWAIFSRICGQRTMTIKGAKLNVPHLLQAQQAPICLCSISETLQCQKFHGMVTKSTVSNRVCWSLKVLWGSVSAVFRHFQ